ncbi:hypothetical protein [Olleya aquimaris]|uniref:TerB family tellurite resistance protein n=1 Tax=Olleya aquimaris TaxID=639310 RepID=A0A327RU25_9FLAO|nr:hypothetical protein [Olleya aquimaris]RAJ17157.1 hypothetical protein LY08_00937 [Olleya aquimaris]
MSNSTNLQQQLYQNLGKLFYAIAMSDGVVENSEIEALKKAVHNLWNNSKDAVVMVDAFHWLNDDREYTSEQCFKSFTQFKKANQDLFSEEIKKKIKDTAIAIASSFAKTNKSELLLLAKLEIELNKD